MDRNSDRIQNFLAALTLCRRVSLTSGERSTKKRIEEVIERSGEPFAFVWELHLAGIVRLSRMDLPQAYQGGSEIREFWPAGFAAGSHFIEYVR